MLVVGIFAIAGLDNLFERVAAPSAARKPEQRMRVEIAAVTLLDDPITGFDLRNRLRATLTATNSSCQSRQPPPIEPRDCVSIEFAFRWPSFILGMSCFSPCPTAPSIAAR